jgi:F-type H+-transporting ATPase subunit b
MHLDWWTLALQTVNVLVLIWILARFFFRPIKAIVAKRQEETSKLFADAAAARKAAADARSEAETARAEVASPRIRSSDHPRPRSSGTAGHRSCEHAFYGHCPAAT